MVLTLEERAKNSDYKSASERIIASYLKRLGVEFEYEDRFCLENERGKATLFYPDFHLKKYGIVIEYLGFKDSKYLEQAEAKRKLYEEQGITVLQIKPEELWNQDEKGKYHLKRDFEEYLVSRINEKISERGQKPIEFGNVDSYLSAYYSRKVA